LSLFAVVEEITKRDATVTNAPIIICIDVLVADFMKILHYSFGLDARADH